jgi:hypothetical protein
MRFVESTFDATARLRTSILAAGLATFMVSGGWCEERAAMRGEATGGLGLTSQRGAESFASSDPTYSWNASEFVESFSSLSQQQQARVLRRCKDVMAKPAEADPNHLTLCQLLATLRR